VLLAAMYFGHLKEESVGVSPLSFSFPLFLLLESSPSIDLESDKKSMLHAAMGNAEAGRRTESSEKYWPACRGIIKVTISTKMNSSRETKKSEDD